MLLSYLMLYISLYPQLKIDGYVSNSLDPVLSIPKEIKIDREYKNHIYYKLGESSHGMCRAVISYKDSNLLIEHEHFGYDNYVDLLGELKCSINKRSFILKLDHTKRIYRDFELSKTQWQHEIAFDKDSNTYCLTPSNKSIQNDFNVNPLIYYKIYFEYAIVKGGTKTNKYFFKQRFIRDYERIWKNEEWIEISLLELNRYQKYESIVRCPVNRNGIGCRFEISLEEGDIGCLLIKNFRLQPLNVAVEENP